MAFTEMTCRSGGSNLSAGSLDGSAEASTTPLVTYASGSLVAATGVFTVAAGDPVAAGVAVGHWASIYPDGTTGQTVFSGRITARTTTTITVSLTAKSGTIPTDGSGNRTLVVGGAWLGPTGTVGFPFGFLQSTMTNSSAHPPRVNFKNDQTYAITAAMTHSNAGPAKFEGYTASFGDDGRATFDGGTTGASYVLLTLSTNTHNVLKNLKFQNNAATGTAIGVLVSAPRTWVIGCVFSSVRGIGYSVSGSQSIAIECEAYACNQSNGANGGGFNAQTTTTFVRCNSHDHSAGSSCHGFIFNNGSGSQCIDCISDSNAGAGFNPNGATALTLIGCEVYNNGTDGVMPNAAILYVENCNFLKNTGYGINPTSTVIGEVRNCGFGTGSQVNTSGTINTSPGLAVTGTVMYAADVTPWVDPANGDFRINLAAAKGTGRGTFTQTASGYAGTVGYPDIGAAQSQASGVILIEDD